MATNKPRAGKHTPNATVKAATRSASAAAAGEPVRVINRTAAGIFLLGFLLYFQSSRFDFTLDDRLVIFENSLTTQGLTAIPEIFSKPYLYGSVAPDNLLYRPVSKAIFALCWTLTPGKPALFHLVNVFFYALTCMLLFLALVKYMPGRFLVPLIVSLLFVLHPVHTEVVCNVKSLDEILALLFFVASLHPLHRYLRTQSIAALILAAAFFFLAFLSKESAVTFLAVYPLLAYFEKAGRSTNLRLAAAILIAAALVFGIRALVLTGPHANLLTEADNILVAAPDALTRLATATALLGKYVLLLLFPHPLVCDHSTKQIDLFGVTSLPFLASLLVLLTALGYALKQALKQDWTAFGILFFFITISVTSNIFFLGGSHFAERFLYTPSLGFCLAAGVALDRYVDPKDVQPSGFLNTLNTRKMLAMLLGIVLLLFGAKTWLQLPVWKNNIALFENGVKHSPRSYRMHLSLAQSLSDAERIKGLSPAEQVASYDRAAREAILSLQYYSDPDAYDIAGNIFYVTGRYDSAVFYYTEGLKRYPAYENLNYHAGKALDKLERYREAIPYLEKALAKNPKNDGVLYNLALSYTNLNELDKGLEYFMDVIELRPDGPDAYHYVGLIYRAKGDLATADTYLRKAQVLGGPRW